jgi:hypothetical protein
MALQNVAWALTGRGLMDCLQYYDNCLLHIVYHALPLHFAEIICGGQSRLIKTIC